MIPKAKLESVVRRHQEIEGFRGLVDEKQGGFVREFQGMQGEEIVEDAADLGFEKYRRLFLDLLNSTVSVEELGFNEQKFSKIKKQIKRLLKNGEYRYGILRSDEYCV